MLTYDSGASLARGSVRAPAPRACPFNAFSVISKSIIALHFRFPLHHNIPNYATLIHWRRETLNQRIRAIQMHFVESTAGDDAPVSDRNARKDYSFCIAS